MIFFKPNICFKLKNLDETALDLVTRIENSNNPYEISRLKELLKTDDISFDTVKSELKNDYNLTVLQGERQLKSIENYWTKVEDEFFKILSEVLDFELFGEVQVYCLLDCLSLPYIDFKGKKLTLPISESLDNNVRFALSLLVKYFILNKFMDNKAENIILNYTKDSVYWIMADLVADSLFFHTELKNYAQNTAYKYFYEIKIKDVNLIDYIRGVYPTMDILDFMEFVFEFAKQNILIFTKFTNRY